MFASRTSEHSLSNHLNLLRFALASLVMVSHAPELLDGNRSREILTSIFHTLSFGELAVNCFFILSGYLILQSWERRPHLFTFLRNRVLRIYPGFVTASLLSLLLVGCCAGVVGFFHDINLWRTLANLILLRPPEGPSAFVGSPYPLINGALWTIEYEFRGYLLIALLGILGLLKKRISLWTLFVAGFVLMQIPVLSTWAQIPGVRFLFGLPNETARFLTFFVVGALFWQERERIHLRIWPALSALGITLLCTFVTPLAQPAMATFGAYFLLWLALTPNQILARLHPSADISYGVYLYGWPIQKLVYWYLPNISPWLGLLLTAALVFPMAWLSWKLVEAPCLRQKHSSSSPLRHT
jgi:peptidoglycan/LPS O-acetylase OafA/YrhL